MARPRRKSRNKNRAWDAPTHVWVMSTRFAVIVVMIVFGVTVHAVLKHHCRAINREIARMEVEQRNLMEKLARDRIRWNQLKTPCNLDTALNRHGIAMGYPSALQVVHMTPSDVPGLYRESAGRPAYASR